MFKIKQLTVCLMLLVCVVVQSQGQQTKSKLDAKIGVMNEIEKRFVNYARDFFDFARSNHGLGQHLEHDLITDLQNVALLEGDRLGAAISIMQIYSLLSCETDRSKIKPIIKREIGGYVKLIKLDIEQVNLNLADTKIPAVATSGTKLKENLREVISILESIELR